MSTAATLLDVSISPASAPVSSGLVSTPLVDDLGYPLHQRRSGRPRSRYRWHEKLRILDPSSSSPEATEAKLSSFLRLFSSRRARGVITRSGQGPRAWTRNRGFIYLEHIVRHLLGDATNLPPQWIGARSWPSSRFFCIDVDADRPSRLSATDELLVRYGKRKPPKSAPSFEQRCHQVEDALRHLGINPENPSHCLIQPTPSGGRHYYIFLDSSYFVFQVRDLLNAVGLVHRPGQIELYPSESQGLRLPFGLVPGTPHNPTAWTDFIDAYEARRIRRFNLAALWDNALIRPTPKRWPSCRSRPQPAVVTNVVPLGPSRSDRQALERYHELISRPLQTAQEAQELIELGILEPGTRFKVTKALAWHLVHVKRLSEDEATRFLLSWLLNERHDSKDIKKALQTGDTARIERDIQGLIRWHVSRRSQEPANQHAQAARFTLPELAALLPSVQALPEDEREDYGHFLLSLLHFAHRHGKPAEGGWEASPAINAVVRRWPGCSKMDYKLRMDHAKASGLLVLTKEKWQRPGGNGRARTYRLNVPSTSGDDHPSFSYDEAISLLTGGYGDGPETSQNPLGRQDETEQGREPEERAERHVLPLAHERYAEPTTLSRLPLEGAGRESALPGRAGRIDIGRDPWRESFGDLTARARLIGIVTDFLLASPRLDPYTRRFLSVPPDELSHSELIERNARIKAASKERIVVESFFGGSNEQHDSSP